MNDFEVDDAAAFRILEILCKFTTLRVIPKEIYARTSFFQSDENIDMFSRCIKNQVELSDLQFDDVILNETAVQKLVTALEETVNLQKIPKEFFNSAFSASDEN